MVHDTPLEAWATRKNFRRGNGLAPGAGRNSARDFHGERRKNDAHVSTTDPDRGCSARGRGGRLGFVGHALMENTNGLIVDSVATRCGHAERLAALALIEPHARRPQPTTLGDDKSYDSTD